MEGKEYYVYGNAEGEWPSWYENGKPSSLGSFIDSTKAGLWKYWDETGWLKTEVVYSEKGNEWTEYYPAGAKKAAGTSVQSGKIGTWTYWDIDGREKAKCDFGRGLFALSSQSCRIIAEDLEPKGFSRPIPVATTATEGSAVLTIASSTYQFSIPNGWIADTEAGKKEEIPLVLYPKGSEWHGPEGNMYIRVIYKNGASFDKALKDEADGFQENVEGYSEKSTTRVRLVNGRLRLSKTICYKPVTQTDSPFAIVSNNNVCELISYVDVSNETVLMGVLTADSESKLKTLAPALLTVVAPLGEKSATSESK